MSDPKQKEMFPPGDMDYLLFDEEPVDEKEAGNTGDESLPETEP